MNLKPIVNSIMSDLAIVPGPDSAYVELSRTKTGKLFKKHILSTGELLYPGVAGGKVKIDQAFLDTLKNNFESKVAPIVQFPMAGHKNEHSEAPDRNIGEVVDLSIEDGKMYAHIDVRKHSDDVGSTILGASAMFSLNYTDTRTGQKVGPSLLHVAATNRPYVVDLDDYEEIVSASADSVNDEAVVLTVSTEKETVIMTLEEILAALKADHNIDVLALQTELESTKTELESEKDAKTTAETSVTEKDAELVASKAEVDKVVAEAEAATKEAADAKEAALQLSNSIVEHLAGAEVISLSNSEEAPNAEAIIAGVASLAEERVSLSNEVNTLREKDAKNAAENRVDSLIREGRILDKNRDDQVTLLLTNSDLFENLVPEKPIVQLSGEELGFSKTDDENETALEAEIERLAKAAQNHGVATKVTK